MTHLLHAPAGASTGSRKGFRLLAALRRALDRARERREIGGARRAADRELLLHPVPSLRHSWRVEELVTPKHRLELARSVRKVVRAADARLALGASPVNRAAARAESVRLLEIADRLADLERPAAARGVLLTEHLLSDAGSPLYDPAFVRALPFYVDAAHDALEPR